MASSWRLSWSQSWANSWGLIGGVAAPVGRRHDYTERELKRQRQFSRQLWDELLEAQEKAEQAGRDRVNAKARAALTRAAQAAQTAYSTVETLVAQEALIQQAQIAQLTRTLNSAANARSLAHTIALSNAAVAQAKAIVDDEEGAIEALLLADLEPAQIEPIEFPAILVPKPKGPSKAQQRADKKRQAQRMAKEQVAAIFAKTFELIEHTAASSAYHEVQRDKQGRMTGYSSRIN